ncbi:hypothetical protein [Luteimonas saliphila]|uniref:hypothetical protein n=1 Tax=Luteimonas saliphila TaxID=2804919 RepID=UPI00192D3BAF|nr:hypothetical protein [Luteimonas saliphila]
MRQRMAQFFWEAVALVITSRPIAQWLMRRAQRTPYFHLTGYMNRWWLFNGYPPKGDDGRDRQSEKRFPRLPSIRVHQILRADLADHPHDHPWDFRTFILSGWYIDERPGQPPACRGIGDTAAIRFGEYHHVSVVDAAGVWTLVILFQHRGKWGFLVDGKKMSPRDYVATYPQRRTEEAES